MRLRRPLFVTTVSLISIMVASSQASAQTIDPGIGADPAMAGPEPQISEQAPIVVTAQRREEALVDVPISITTINAQQLRTANVTELSDIGNVTPGLRFDRQSQFVQPTIRGIGTSITTSGGGSNVGIYVDGFYSPNPAEADFELMNVKSVQVLKGPQGTLFGRNTTGGAILVDTADPSIQTGAAVRASISRFDRVRAQAYVTGGLTDTLAIDAEALYASGDAFQRNLATGRRDRGYRNWQVRTGLKLDLGTVSAKLRYQHAETDDARSLFTNIYVDPELGLGTSPNYPPQSYTTDPDFYSPGADRPYLVSNADVVQLTVEADLGFADLTSYSQYRDQNSDSSLDLDKTALTIFQFGIPLKNKTVTQEFLLTSKPGTPLQYTAGLFYLYNSDRYETFGDNGVSSGAGRIRVGGSDAPTRSYAAFVDATYEVTPSLFVTAGVRYAHDRIDDAYYNVGTEQFFVPDISSNTFTPRVVLRYKPDSATSIYASYAKGYKAAISDVGGSCQGAPDFSCNDVAPENVDAFEVGLKHSSGGFSFETAAFYYDYRNLQVSLFTAGQAEIVNAANAMIYGVEGAANLRLGSGFSVNAGATYVHGRSTEFPGAPVYVPCRNLGAEAQQSCAANGLAFVVQPTDLDDVKMQRTPEFTGNIGARYETGLGAGSLALSGNFYYTSSFNFGPSGTQFRGGNYEVLSLRAEWRDPTDKFFVAVFGDNVTDNRYVNQVQYNNFGLGATWSDPATYGLEIGFRY